MSERLKSNLGGAKGKDPRRRRSASALGRASEDETVAVIVHHRQAQALRYCLHNLSEAAPRLRVVVVENGSRDQSVTAVRMAAVEQKTVTLVERPFCHGFAAGANCGIEKALELLPDLSQVLMIGVDTIVSPGFLDQLIETRQRHPEAGVVGTTLGSTEHRATLFEQGVFRGRLQIPTRADAPDSGIECAVDFVDGGCALLTSKFLAEGHRFDTGYFAFLEDVDLCRTAIDAGFEVWLRRDTKVRRTDDSERELCWDPIASQPAQVLRRVAASRVYFSRKWLERWPRTRRILQLAIVESLLGSFWSLSRGGRPRFLSTWFQGLRDGLGIALPGTESRIPKTRLVDARRFSDDELDDELEDGDFEDEQFEDGDGDGWGEEGPDDEGPDDGRSSGHDSGTGPGLRPEKSDTGRGVLGSARPRGLGWLETHEDDGPRSEASPDLFGLDDSEDVMSCDEFVVAFDRSEWIELTGASRNGESSIEVDPLPRVEGRPSAPTSRHLLRSDETGARAPELPDPASRLMRP